MKKKLIVLLGLVLLMLLSGMSYLLYAKDQQRQQQLLQSQQAAQKQIADLNDRLVAVARQQAVNTSNSNPAQPIRLSPSQQVYFNQQRNSLRLQQRQWTLTALDMAQDNLRQGNTKKAQQLLLELQQNTIDSQQDLGDVFNNTLLQTLKIDQLNLAQHSTRQQQARAGLNQSLLQIQQQLNQMAVQAPQGLLVQSSASKETGIGNWFKHLFLIERATPEAGQHMLDRSFIYKQASINVAISRLALAQGDQLNFTSNLTEAFTQLNLLADPASRQMAQQLDKLKNQPWPANIELTSLTLLTGQKASS